MADLEEALIPPAADDAAPPAPSPRDLRILIEDADSAQPSTTGPRVVGQDGEHGDDGDPSSSPASTGAATPAQTVANVVQVFTGIGLLSMPYAMRLGGWSGLGALALACVAFRASAGLLAAGLAALPPGVPRTLPSLTQAALGPACRPVAGALALAEFGGGATLTLAVVLEQAALLVPAAAAARPGHLAAAVVAALTPALALPSFRRLAPLSLVGCASTLAVAVAVAACVVADPGRRHYGGGGGAPPPPNTALLRPGGLVRGAGIFAMAVSGHSSIPSLRASMADPSRFPRVLDAAFGFMAVVYGGVAAAGYFYFGDAAAAVVTANLAADAPFARRALLPSPPFPRALTVDAVVGWAVLANALTTLPSMLMVVQETAWSLTPWARGLGTSAAGLLCRPGLGPTPALRRPRRWVRFSLRVCVAGLAAAAATAAASSLGDAIALVGGLAALACSLLLPTACYARVVGVEGRPWAAAGLGGLTVGGVGLGLVLVGQSV